MLNKNNAEYLAYKSFEEDIRDTLESDYNMAVYHNNMAAAYEILGKMMEYRLIEVNDTRIEKNNKSFIKHGIAKDHRFFLDYRKDTNYIPGWLYNKLTPNSVIQINTIEHWGKRVEGNYEGDAIFPSRSIKLRFTLCNNARKIENSFTEIVKILNTNGIKFNKDVQEDLCKEGVYRVYEILVEGNCVYQYSKIGYAIVRMGHSDVETMLIANYESLVSLWLPVNGTVLTLKDTLTELVGSSIVRLAISADNAFQKQLNLVNKSNSMTVALKQNKTQ